MPPLFPQQCGPFKAAGDFSLHALRPVMNIVFVSTLEATPEDQGEFHENEASITPILMAKPPLGWLDWPKVPEIRIVMKGLRSPRQEWPSS